MARSDFSPLIKSLSVLGYATVTVLFLPFRGLKSLQLDQSISPINFTNQLHQSTSPRSVTLGECLRICFAAGPPILSAGQAGQIQNFDVSLPRPIRFYRVIRRRVVSDGLVWKSR
jgi:hypothetical protein